MKRAVRSRAMRAVAGIALGALLLGAASALAQSAGQTVAGPFTVTLPSTQTFSFSTGFKVPAPLAHSYVVRVALSVPNSLTALSVRLNNTQVFALSDFAGGVTRVDRVATLLLSNTIALQVAGLKGTRITVTVFTAVRANAPPAVTLTSPANGATFTAPATVPLAATATDSDGSIARVDFFQSANLIGTATRAPYTFGWTNVAPGSYALTARATDNEGATRTSTAVTITVNSGVAQVYYIAPDHLNTPRMIANQQGTTVWRWDQGEPFGNDVPNNNPSGAGAFEFNMRFPGQYFDRETGLLYNVNRDYWPDGGRYIESDPIGIRAGLNTYLYVNGDPLGSTDPLGLMGYGGGGSANPGRPMTPTPITPTPAPSCDGRWVFIRMTRDPFFVLSGNCTCWWSCYSCPNGPGDAFPDPNLGQYATPGKLVFTEKYGKNYDPKKGDTCLCDKPGPAKACCGSN